MNLNQSRTGLCNSNTVAIICKASWISMIAAEIGFFPRAIKKAGTEKGSPRKKKVINNNLAQFFPCKIMSINKKETDNARMRAKPPKINRSDFTISGRLKGKAIRVKTREAIARRTA